MEAEDYGNTCAGHSILYAIPKLIGMRYFVWNTLYKVGALLRNVSAIHCALVFLYADVWLAVQGECNSGEYL